MGKHQKVSMPKWKKVIQMIEISKLTAM